MKLILASDVHYGNKAPSEGDGPFEKEAHAEFAAEMHSHKPDVLVVAGDCGETCMSSKYLPKMLDVYKNPHGDSICIPGNHDVWLNGYGKMGHGRDSHWEQYDWFFKEARCHGWSALRTEPWSKDGVWIAGSMGWYDFSSSDPMVCPGMMTPEEYDKRHDWSDYGWMRMDSALQVNRERMHEFDKCLSKVPPKGDAGRRWLMVVSHFIGFRELMATDFPRPDTGAAFMGNYSIGEKAAAVGADMYYCGHSHRRKEFVHASGMRCVNNGSGYGHGSKRYDVVEVPDAPAAG